MPVPEKNLTRCKVSSGFQIGQAELEVFYTPGHASHHVTYWIGCRGPLFVGDYRGDTRGGRCVSSAGHAPPDIDVEIWNQSLDILRPGTGRIFLTHFGFIEIGAHIRLYKERLAQWSALTRQLLESGAQTTEAEKQFVDAIASEIKSTLPRMLPIITF